MPAAVFLLVAGIGVVASSVGRPSKEVSSPAHTERNSEMLASLGDYTRSLGKEDQASAAPAGKLLPDVNTMIERLAARLETTPNDLKGWRMLGWSYFNTGRYKQAVTAYGKALELDPNSAELKASYEEAKAKVTELDNLEKAAAQQAGAQAAPGHDAFIRSMVDGLASRLESSPRDVEGWTRLMRSRVVLGEMDAAATAFRRALDVFKDDSEASGKIKAAALELGIKSE